MAWDYTMAKWDYKRTENTFDKIPEGIHRVRIREVEKAQSAAGNDMLVLVYDVSGTNSRLWDRIVFLKDRPEITNRNLTQFFDSFADIPEGNFNINSWVGKVGAVDVFHNGDYVNVKKYIPKSAQAELPPWKEAGDNSVNMNDYGFTEVDDDFPF